MATRAVNKTAKEGEQNARLLLSRGALSAMAIFRRGAFPSVRRWRCTAPYPLLAPAAPALCLSCFWRGDALQVLPSAPFFCGEGGSYLVRGESRRSSMARSSRMRSRATGSGNILARCVPGRSTMAKCSRDAFPSVRRWRDCAPVAYWAASTASSPRGTATALCQHQPVACRPGEQLCHRRQRLLWRQHPRRHRPADSPSCARPKGGLPSLLVSPVFCALGRCDRFVNARQSPFYAIISLWLRKNRHPSGKTQALPIQWVGCSRDHVPYRTINKEKRLRWQLLHIALSARKRRKW